MNTATFLSWIPGWLGFLVLILVGAAMVINGGANQGLDATNRLGFIVFGLCALLIGAFSWIVGASSKIRGRVGKVGARVAIQDMPWWAWVVDLGLLVTAIAIFLAAR
jgi:hypothetical protein